MNTPIIDPSKVIFGSLGIAWCTSTNLQSDQSASFSWKRWFAKQAFTLAGNITIEMVQALISANFVSVFFVSFGRRCPMTAAILVP